jgi:HD-like signal output (HDOD) protein
MTAIWMALAAMAAVAAWCVLRPRASNAAATRAAQTPAAAAAPPTTFAASNPEPEVAAVPSEQGPMPEALAVLSFRNADRVASEKVAAIVGALQAIPRPPQALHQLVSIEFMAQANSSDIAEVVMREPMIAAKVMAKIHSPVYGLRQPITKIGQAITYLGTQSVRNVCMRYLLAESFKTDNPHINKIFEYLGETSTLASELCLRLAQRLNVADPGALMTHVLLSFTGHLAATVLQVHDRPAGSRAAPASLIQRVYGQQQELGLSGSEVGRLLMRDWQLPEALIDSVAAIDRVLVTPVEANVADNAAHAGLGYMCARLAERIVSGQISDLRHIDSLLEMDADFYHLPGYLALPALRGWREEFKSSDLLTSLRI